MNPPQEDQARERVGRPTRLKFTIRGVLIVAALLSVDVIFAVQHPVLHLAYPFFILVWVVLLPWGVQPNWFYRQPRLEDVLTFDLAWLLFAGLAHKLNFTKLPGTVAGRDREATEQIRAILTWSSDHVVTLALTLLTLAIACASYVYLEIQRLSRQPGHGVDPHRPGPIEEARRRAIESPRSDAGRAETNAFARSGLRFSLLYLLEVMTVAAVLLFLAAQYPILFGPFVAAILVTSTLLFEFSPALRHRVIARHSILRWLWVTLLGALFFGWTYLHPELTQPYLFVGVAISFIVAAFVFHCGRSR